MYKLKLICTFSFFLLPFTFICLAQDTKEAPQQPPKEEIKQEVKQEPPRQQAKEESKEEVPLPKPDIEFSLDVNSKTVPLPKIFSPSVDLSGRGFHKDKAWPYHLASKQVIEKWQQDIGFNKGLFRLHWNLWEVKQGKKIEEALQQQILANYEMIIKNISDAGGTVILSLYGTPPGFGRALDKRSPPSNLKQWKLLVKNTVRYLSCEKKYNIWYEVWDTPDKDDFFLGEKRDYLNLYRFTAEAIKELKREKRIMIPLGGPCVTWWFQNFDGNSIINPEKSLIYELIKFCSQQKLPLDFISWHAYSSDPYAEKEVTTYNKAVSQLIRDWLTFFRLDKNSPLIIDEWNYDSGGNIIEERGAKSYIAASYIPSRLKNMAEAGIDYQTLFCLEDFQNDKEVINNNRGLFSYDPKAPNYHGEVKSIYNVLLMLNLLGDSWYKSANINDEFLNLLATKKGEDIIILLWNYIDPYVERSFLTRNITLLGEKGRAGLLSMVKEGQLNKIISGELSLDGISGSDKLKGILKKSAEIKAKSLELINKPLNIKISLSNIKGDYLYQRYAVDSSCATDCPFSPAEEKELTNIDGAYQEILSVNPYSVHLIILKKKIANTETRNAK